MKIEREKGFIHSLTPLWRHFEAEGYEPHLILDLRPWAAVFYSAKNGRPESWLVCLSAECPSDVYDIAIHYLPDTLGMEGFGSVNGNDYMVFEW